MATLGVMTGEDVPGGHERRRRWTTALGDDVNDAARIEACATGGLTLASKHLIERLNPTQPTNSISTSIGSATPSSES